MYIQWGSRISSLHMQPQLSALQCYTRVELYSSFAQYKPMSQLTHYYKQFSAWLLCHINICKPVRHNNFGS